MTDRAQPDGLWEPRGATARAIVLGGMAVNLTASLAMALVLRGATAAGGSIPERIAFIAGHRALVSASWYAWILASVALVLVIFTVLRSLPGRPALKHAAFTLLLIGAVPDLCNNLIGAAILPALAGGWGAADPALRAAIEVDFQMWDRFSVLLTGLLGNLLYACCGFVLAAHMARTPGFPRPLVWLSVPLWTATLGIAVASVIDSTPALVGTVGVTMTLFCLWCTWIAVRWLGRSDAIPR